MRTTCTSVYEPRPQPPRPIRYAYSTRTPPPLANVMGYSFSTQYLDRMLETASQQLKMSKAGTLSSPLQHCGEYPNRQRHCKPCDCDFHDGRPIVRKSVESPKALSNAGLLAKSRIGLGEGGNSGATTCTLRSDARGNRGESTSILVGIGPATTQINKTARFSHRKLRVNPSTRSRRYCEMRCTTLSRDASGRTPGRSFDLW
jgi:hypothetical protein